MEKSLKDRRESGEGIYSALADTFSLAVATGFTKCVEHTQLWHVALATSWQSAAKASMAMSCAKTKNKNKGIHFFIVAIFA